MGEQEWEGKNGKTEMGGKEWEERNGKKERKQKRREGMVRLRREKRYVRMITTIRRK